jgi:streptogramin lyase
MHTKRFIATLLLAVMLLWFTEFSVRGNAIGRITPTGEITEFRLPNFSTVPGGITAGADGDLWFTEHDRCSVGRITPAGAITEFSLQLPFSACSPTEIASGSDGNLWFTLHYRDSIGRMTPAGVFTEFAIGVEGFRPRSITAGPDGNLWFTEASSFPYRIGRMAPSGDGTLFVIPSGRGAASITTGSDDNLWFTRGRAALAV